MTKELLRRFYLKNGYADFEVLNATAELSPDRTGFFVTFAIHEGERYRLGTVTAHLADQGRDAGRPCWGRPTCMRAIGTTAMPSRRQMTQSRIMSTTAAMRSSR